MTHSQIPRPHPLLVLNSKKKYYYKNLRFSVKTLQGYKIKLDRWSIGSSPRYGLSTPYKSTFRNSARLLHHVLFNMGCLHLVLPALNLFTLNAGILIMMKQVSLMMFLLNMVLLHVLPIAVHLSLLLDK